MLTARPASHSGNDACADAATASPHGVDTRACTALTDSRDRGHASQERLASIVHHLRWFFRPKWSTSP
jgi:hypothetical protein